VPVVRAHLRAGAATGAVRGIAAPAARRAAPARGGGGGPARRRRRRDRGGAGAGRARVHRQWADYTAWRMTAVWIVVALLVALLIYLILAYNKLVRLRNEGDSGFSSIDVQLQRRADLIPNLVESVKAYAVHESSVFEAVSQARSATLAATSLPATAAADALMQSAITGLLGIAEAYPQLRAVESFKAL